MHKLFSRRLSYFYHFLPMSTEFAMYREKCYTARVQIIFKKVRTVKVYIFFNCDEKKSAGSMNIFYSNAVFHTSRTSRRKLLDRVEIERAAGRVKIAEEDIAKVESLILDGDATEASKFIQYGAIMIFDCI